MNRGAAARKVDRKKELCFEIAAVVRKVQKQCISSMTGAGSDGGDRRSDLSREVEQLCIAVEAVFLHELKNSKCVLWRDVHHPNPSILPEPSFWGFLEPLVQDEIKTQLLALRNSESDVRKCRSWVRLMLSKNLMVSSLEDLQRHPGLIGFHYGEGALLRDLEQSEIIIQLLRGLTVLQLPYDYTSSKLGSWEPTCLMLAGIWEGPERAPSSPSVRRVSPPTSDFEGVAIIDMALDKYKKKRSPKLSDSQLISREISQRHSSTPSLDRSRREGGSVSSMESGSGHLLESEPFGAMLRSYARKTEPPVVEGGGWGVGISSRNRAQEERREDEGTWSPGEKGGESDEEDTANKENFKVALSLNYEIISSDGSLVESHNYEPHLQQKQLMVEHLVKLVTEKGLDSQNYKCCGCNRDIGLIFGQAKLCKFNGQHYCYECHRDDERVIPARVLFNWDFRLHKVCLASCEYLDSVEFSPILDVEQTNKALYLYIPTLEEALKLRLQCKYLMNYLSTCKDTEALEQFTKKMKSPYLYDDIHRYSVKDLMDVNNGSFSDRAKKLVKIGTKHVKRCSLCSQKGFICEMCHDPRVIYPFDLGDTFQCDLCKALYHKECSPEQGSCPKCLRLRQRASTDQQLKSNS